MFTGRRPRECHTDFLFTSSRWKENQLYSPQRSLLPEIWYWKFTWVPISNFIKVEASKIINQIERAQSFSLTFVTLSDEFCKTHVYRLQNMPISIEFAAKKHPPIYRVFFFISCTLQNSVRSPLVFQYRNPFHEII